MLESLRVLKTEKIPTMLTVMDMGDTSTNVTTLVIKEIDGKSVIRILNSGTSIFGGHCLTVKTSQFIYNKICGLCDNETISRFSQDDIDKFLLLGEDIKVRLCQRDKTKYALNTLLGGLFGSVIGSDVYISTDDMKYHISKNINAFVKMLLNAHISDYGLSSPHVAVFCGGGLCNEILQDLITPDFKDGIVMRSTLTTTVAMGLFYRDALCTLDNLKIEFLEYSPFSIYTLVYDAEEDTYCFVKLLGKDETDFITIKVAYECSDTGIPMHFPVYQIDSLNDQITSLEDQDILCSKFGDMVLEVTQPGLLNYSFHTSWSQGIFKCVIEMSSFLIKRPTLLRVTEIRMDEIQEGHEDDDEEVLEIRMAIKDYKMK